MANIDDVINSFDNIVELVDEDGNEVRFDLLSTIDYEGDVYAVLEPVDKVEGIEDGEVIILRIEPGEGDEDDVYTTVEDEETAEAVFNRFLELTEAEEIAEDEEDDE